MFTIIDAIIITVLSVVIFILTFAWYYVDKDCYEYNKEYFDIDNKIAIKYFGENYVNIEPCAAPIIDPIDISLGNIKEFLSMQGKVYKIVGIIYNIDHPNSEDYIMLDKVNLDNGTAHYYRSTTNFTTGEKTIESKCVNLDLSDPYKLIANDFTITYSPDYNWFTITIDKGRLWILKEQTE